MISCELNFDPVFRELEGAKHYPCIVSEKQKNGSRRFGFSINRLKMTFAIWGVGREGWADDHIRMLSGRSRALKLSANDLTDRIEQRSSLRTSTFAVLHCSSMKILASFAASIFLAAMITWAPRRASTLAVSNPMPLAPPRDLLKAIKLYQTTSPSILHCYRLLNAPANN